MELVPEWFYLLSLAGFGMLFGSFANVVIWRVPRGESIVSPASHCPSCGASITWYDNVPVLSWLLLHGRCRACGERIAIRYPLVEALSGLLWATAGIAWGVSIRTVFAVLLFYLLMILAFIDIDHRRLPNVLVLILGGCGLAGLAATYAAGVPVLPLTWSGSASAHSSWLGSAIGSAAIGVVLGGGLPLAISLVYGVLRGQTGLGMGDVKLLGVLGLFMGPYTILVLFLGSVIGAVTGVFATRKTPDARMAKIPFGPFIALAAVICALWGPLLWGAYAGIAGL